MKQIIHRVFLLSTFFICSVSYSQNLTGIWRGYFITENDDQYKFELQLDQTGSRISGVSYSYLTTVFYGKAVLTGNFKRKENSALITEIKTVELRMSTFSAACIMKCSFQYAVSGKEQFLEGTFTSKFEKNGIGAKKGDDCGSGKVYLRKVRTSDFYVEPFLRSKLRADSIREASPPIKKNVTVTKPPVNKSTVKKTPPSVVKKSTVKKNPPMVSNPPPVNKIIITPNTNTKTITKVNPPEKQTRDSAQKIDMAETKEIIQKTLSTIPDVLKNRENALVKTLVVNNQNVTIKLYDNGVVDGDTISVYVDKKLVLSRKGLSEKPITLNLKMGQDNDEHEVTMVAENLGSIPPNTSLMIVEAGDQRFDVFISSNEQKNAVVRFRYQKPKDP
ncbi:MAG: hypothetical protein JST17_09870 [Bacteroidetes bacterium]|nr:hypothetical protein [Bacteroidota bacterium]MBS1930014.1 hypothetical protein [Bacteroidota bacterium]